MTHSSASPLRLLPGLVVAFQVGENNQKIERHMNSRCVVWFMLRAFSTTLRVLTIFSGIIGQWWESIGSRFEADRRTRRTVNGRRSGQDLESE